ncbi:hypothetical protein CCASEI_00050 [Corynebacterium casei LMG S-19264]|uniref:Uncharacterized protein n=1 Tax=Corynebacterium casei LMG S-19264 TaxID=1285583 RepID=A0ABM5PL72_9CORY|nr:hypothetical protein CCASEI_00050 [Corynebacterium casei LMG S-19264]
MESKGTTVVASCIHQALTDSYRYTTLRDTTAGADRRRTEPIVIATIGCLRFFILNLPVYSFEHRAKSEAIETRGEIKKIR